ncbi:hypothetical protein EGW08_010052 [Elysia chlorotica]|uniref:Fcf2 pre-rRNA processing C-terminal domain-containing protein n=1 Tax=Elysia chlorotica TaxID=188477 RepID=A0A3S1HM22_ELYCH|nr:hypothetical protein EGW08_010052 [Elysia chlorotica]
MPKGVKSEFSEKKGVISTKLDESNTSGSSSTSSDESESVSSECPPSLKHKVLKNNVTLSCLRKWNSEKIENSFQNYVSKLQKKKRTVKIGAPKLSNVEDFTPWWDEFVKPPRKASFKTEGTLTKDTDSFNNWFSKSCPQSSSTSWLCGSRPNISEDKPAQSSALVEDIEVPSIYSQKPKTKGRRALKRERKAEREKTLGKKWFEMRAPEVDDSTRMDMEMIRMRGVLDPKRFYKHNDRGALPKYFQMGTVVDEGTDFYSSRLTKKQRKQTLVEELMADANIRQYNKRKYSEVQQKLRNKKFKGKKSGTS